MANISAAYRRPISVLSASAIFWIISGCSFVAIAWWPKSHDLAAKRMALCALLIAVLHWVGYRFFINQGDLTLSAETQRHFKHNMIFQACISGFATLILDGGAIFRLTLVASLGYLCCVVLILSRRDPESKGSDRAMLANGYFVALGLAVLAQGIIWRGL